MKKIICIILLSVTVLMLPACQGGSDITVLQSGSESSFNRQSESRPDSLDSPSSNGISPDSSEESSFVPEPDSSFSSESNTEKTEEHPMLMITELMVKNKLTVADKNGKYLPYIEFYNRSSETVFLSEYRLSLDGKKYSLPDLSLLPEQYSLLFCGSDIALSLPEAGQITLYHGENRCQSFSYLNKTDHAAFDVATGSETATPTPGYKNVAAGTPITFSEILIQNTLYPISGKLVGYLELYNGTDKDIALDNIYLSNDKNDLYSKKLPSGTLKAGEYLVLTFEELKMVPSAFSSTLYLTRNDGVICGCLGYPNAEKNVSVSAKGSVLPSPGYPNTEEGRKSYFSAQKGLIISEVISSNTKYYPINGLYCDLVELYNNGTEEINLQDYYLSDSYKKLFGYALPDQTLAPGKYAVLPLTGKGGKESSFKLSSEGDRLYLTKKDGYVADAVSIPAIPVNRSYGRYDGKWVYFAVPSFGMKNGLGYETLSPTPSASLESGFYKGAQQVTLRSDGGVIFYTTDGSAATAASKEYKGETLTFSKNTTLRMLCYKGEQIPSNEVVYNYFIDALDLSLPIVKVSVDNADFYGENGIYTLNNEKTSNKEIGANFSFYLDGKEEFSVNCGIKVFGNSSRTLPKKSYQLKFRAIYGTSTLKYDIFEDGKITEFNSLVLRSGSQDYTKSMMRDEFASGTVLAYSSEVLAQNYRPVNLYINEKYIGVYYIREKIDEDFVASHYGVSPESVTIMQSLAWTETGSNGASWQALYRYICNNDLSVKENYEYVASRLSIESTVDYYLFLTWADNRDWGNVRVFQSTEGDGKWRFIFYDCDLAFGRYSQKTDSAKFLYGSYKPVEPEFNAVIYKLLLNDTFRDLFLKRLAELNKTAFSDDAALSRLASIQSAIDHDMHYLVYGVSYDYWKNDPVDGVPQLISYLTDRSQKLVNDLTALFGLTEKEVQYYFG